jgi:hypothetical protein
MQGRVRGPGFLHSTVKYPTQHTAEHTSTQSNMETQIQTLLKIGDDSLS